MTPVITDADLANLDRLIEFSIPMPKACTVIVYPSTEYPGDTIIKASVEAIDVETGELGSFTTTWRGVNPKVEDVVRAIRNMLKHEIEEHMGLDPHRLPQ